MATTDLEIKEEWLEKLQAQPRRLIEMIVKRRRDIFPQFRVQMSVWMNPDQDPWDKGVDLVEICGNPLVHFEYNFEPERITPRDGWPRQRVILTDVQELTEDVEISGVVRSYAEKIRLVLDQFGDRAMIYPSKKTSAVGDFRALVNGIV
jgi:hypothetical protein